MGRYTRDELLTQALDLAMSPPLNTHDRPGDVIDQNAYSIKWLQSALDRVHVKFPFSTDIQDVPIVFSSSSVDVTLLSDSTKYLPTDFILDVKDGVTYTYGGKETRLKRRTFQQWLSIYNDTKNQRVAVPSIYCMIQNRIKIAPVPSTNLSGTLWYYKLPGIIHASEYPNFPDEWTLIEYVHVKALEWNHSVDIGTGQVFLEREVARLKAAGLLNDTEYDQVPIENNQVFVSPGLSRNAWMGDVAR
jgi:hypothetical protein